MDSAANALDQITVGRSFLKCSHMQTNRLKMLFGLQAEDFDGFLTKSSIKAGSWTRRWERSWSRRRRWWNDRRRRHNRRMRQSWRDRQRLGPSWNRNWSKTSQFVSAVCKVRDCWRGGLVQRKSGGGHIPNR